MEHDWRRRVIRIYGPDRHIIEVGEAMQFAIVRDRMRRTVNELHERGYGSVHYPVSKANERALCSYAKLEFTRVGETNLYGEPWWCYEKALQELI